MEPRPTSRLTWLDEHGAVLEGPLEWLPCFLEINERVEYWNCVSVTCQGRPLQPILTNLGNRARILVSWPRSGAGTYQIVVHSPSLDVETTTTIYPRKITRQAFAKLVEDLILRLPVAVAIGLQSTGGLAKVGLLSPQDATLAQELVRLRRAILLTDGRPGLVDILNELFNSHHQRLRSTEIWVPTTQARRPHPARLALALASGRNLDSRGIPQLLLDTRVNHTPDTYENRLLKIYTEEVRLRIRHVRLALEALRNSDQTAIARALEDALARARRRAVFLDDVPFPQYLPTQTTMVLLKVPAYRAAFEGFIELHKSLPIRLEEPGLDAPLEQVPALYQTWGTMQVIIALLGAAAQNGYVVVNQQLVTRDARGFLVKILRGGVPALALKRPRDGVHVFLTPERGFAKSGKLRSISYEQRPDVVVEIVVHDNSRLYLFDPKYKLENEVLPRYPLGSEAADSDASVSESTNPRPTKLDIDKMHTYRDAIRDESDQRVVEYAAILYPGPSISYGYGIEALGADPSADGPLMSRLQEILNTALA